MDGGCDYCGDPLTEDCWYPVSMTRDADERLLLYYFCSESCQAAFDADP